MCVDIHPGKLREVRFIPGTVGKSLLRNFLLRNEHCLLIQKNFLAGVEINLNNAS
jgi:hypothetical protein